MTTPAPLQIPDDLRAMLEAVRRVGRPRLVGGGVRDWLLGMKPKDFDVEVAGTEYDRLHRALEMYGPTDVIGRSFGVIKVRSAVTGNEYDFSLPRRESKTGAGHRGFVVAANPNLTDAEAAARRDFTINAIALDPFTGEIIDPHNGRRDLAARQLRATSAAFVEDPLRVLRAFQLAARFELTMVPETAALCRSIRHTYPELAVERVWGEWDKWATKAVRPSRGLTILEETGWLEHFPEVAALRGTPQEPEWHPEGDVFTHTQHCLDALVQRDEYKSGVPARRRLLMLAVLAHDFGKPTTTARAEKRGALRWVSPGHEAAGAEPTRTFLRRIGAPLDLDDPVCGLVVNHLAHHHGQVELSDSGVRRLARKLAPATIDDLAVVMHADAGGRPPLQSPEIHARIDALVAQAHALAIADAAPKPIILGRHLLSLGMKPGPEMKPLIDAAFEAQLDGAFADEKGGVEWLSQRLGKRDDAVKE